MVTDSASNRPGSGGAALPDADWPEPHLIGAKLPCEFGRCADVLAGLIETHRPDVVICVGEAAGRAALSVERVAINVDDARIPDNAGRQPIDEPVVPGGPAAYFSTVPIKAAAARVRDAGLPVAVSQTAGTYVCNHVFYRLMHLIGTRFPHIRGGFVHVPSLPDNARQAVPSMSVADAASGITHVVRACLLADVDIAVAEGAEH